MQGATAGRASERAGDAARARRAHRLELAAAGVLAAGGILGLVVWAKWGFLVAFDAMLTYCFG